MSHLDRWLEGEIAHGLWDVEIDGVHPWAMIRYDVLQAQIDKAYSQNAPFTPQPSTWRRLGQRHMPHKLPSVLMELYTPLRSKRNAIFFLFKADRAQGTRTNRLNYRYLERLRPPLIFESNAYVEDLKIPADPNFGSSTFSQEALLTWTQLLSLPQRLGSKYEQPIRDFVEHAANSMGFTGNRGALIGYVRSCISYRRGLEHIAKRLAGRLSSPIALINNSTYAGLNGLTAHAMRLAGLHTFDIQHGMIGNDYPAYQYPLAIMEDPTHPARRYLPDIFLTFGPWWETVAHLPVRFKPVGYPHLNETLNRLVQNEPVNPRSILVVSQGTVTQRMIDLTLFLSAQLPDHSITFKPHPMELHPPGKFAVLNGLPNVTLVERAEILELIARNAVIVGFNSTSLFEAVAFAGKRILFWKNDLVPDEIGQPFESKDEAAAMIRQGNIGFPQTESSALWLPESEPRIDAVMREFEGLSASRCPTPAEASTRHG